MAFGFPPQYAQDVSLDDLAPGQMLVVALQAAEGLGWQIIGLRRSGFRAHTGMSLLSWGEEVTVTLDNGLLQLRSRSTGLGMLDFGRNRRHVAALLSGMEAQRLRWPPEELWDRYRALEKDLEDDGDVAAPRTGTLFGEWRGLFSIFIPRGGMVVTALILDLNILLFLLVAGSGGGIFSPGMDILLRWGGLFRPSVLEGQWWRMLSCLFVHRGIFHLGMNMSVLVAAGMWLEPRLGRARFALAFLLSGLAGSMASIWWRGDRVAVGASGAIFGLLGVLLVLLLTRQVEKQYRMPLLLGTVALLAYNLLCGLTAASVDYAAHLGGLAAGILIGLAFLPGLRHPASALLRYGIQWALVLAVAGAWWQLRPRLPSDMRRYIEGMETIAINESMALEVLQMPANTPKERLLEEFRERGMYYWRQNILLVDSLEKLNLPPRLHAHNRVMLDYCRARIASYKWICRGLEQPLSRYQDSLQYYQEQVQHLMLRLKEKNPE